MEFGLFEMWIRWNYDDKFGDNRYEALKDERLDLLHLKTEIDRKKVAFQLLRIIKSQIRDGILSCLDP
jgi:hypothetical protein